MACLKLTLALTKWPITEILLMVQGLLLLSFWVAEIFVVFDHDNMLAFLAILPCLFAVLTVFGGILALFVRRREREDTKQKRKVVHGAIILWVMIIFVINTACQTAAVLNVDIKFGPVEILAIIFSGLYWISVACFLGIVFLQRCFLTKELTDEQSGLKDELLSP